MEEDVEKLLELLPEDLNQAEVAVVANRGTVQAMLSAMFKEKIEVKIDYQINFFGKIIRRVEFKKDKQTIGFAITIIPSYTDIRFKECIQNKSIGSCLKEYNCSREILKIFTDQEIFGRTYKLVAEKDNCKFELLITEVFYRKFFS